MSYHQTFIIVYNFQVHELNQNKLNYQVQKPKIIL